VEALIDGRVVEQATLWEIAQLLRLPTDGPYVAIAAASPALGRHAMPGIEPKLNSLDIVSAWRLLPDVQLGIAAVRDDEQFATLRGALERAAVARIGISSRFDDLRDTSDAVRYARIALTAQSGDDSLVSVFEDEPLTIAAVSSPRVMKQLAAAIFANFADLEEEDRLVLFSTFRTWAAEGGSINAAAERLYCHPNTVRYRLRRIEERTGKSVGKPLDLAELCLAFEIDRRLA
jgi:DNA-binding PucR family transcriptional regulator